MIDKKNFDKIMFNVMVTTVPADGLAPLGARPSAGTVMTNFVSCVYEWPWHMMS